ncbi:MAG: SIS domain-containing protein [Chitinivibrionales bacterium]|nr:SIS domain-containing protein [Chitinivibrionales bacterium]
MKKHILTSLQEAKVGLDRLLADTATIDAIETAGRCLVSTLSGEGKVFSCGNGGSMCDAIHFAEELTGRFRKDRAAHPAIAISDPGHISCVANDYGYEYVFSRYIEAHGKQNDSLIAISTSGSSKNIVNAATTAKSRGISVIGLTGKPNGELEKYADIIICTPAGAFADRVQELHIKVLHILIELIERSFHPQNY